MTARDIRYGRQGGRIVAWDHPPLDISTAPACAICGRPMLLGQNVRHWTCGPICPGCHLWLGRCTCRRT